MAQIFGMGVNPTDRSGTITAGGTAQQVMALNTSRYGFCFMNISDTDMYICFTGTATAGAGSLKIPAGALYETMPAGVPVGAVSVFCATTGKAFTAWEW